jgi:hypothetical protein
MEHAWDAARKRRRNRKIISLSLLLAVGAVSAPFVYDLLRDRPNLYDPARTALVAAQRNLSEAYAHVAEERELLEQVKAAHQDLRDALALVDQAERLDPADKAAIDALQAQLARLEDDGSILQMDDEQVRATYQGISEQLQTLIEKRE